MQFALYTVLISYRSDAREQSMTKLKRYNYPYPSILPPFRSSYSHEIWPVIPTIIRTPLQYQPTEPRRMRCSRVSRGASVPALLHKACQRRIKQNYQGSFSRYRWQFCPVSPSNLGSWLPSGCFAPGCLASSRQRFSISLSIADECKGAPN